MSETFPTFYGDLSTTKFVKDGTARATTPKKGERVQRQSHGRVAWGGYIAPNPCGSYRPMDGVATSDCSFPYWHMLLWGIEPVYRLMLQQQTIALARYIVTGPVRASTWDMTWDDEISKDDPAIQWVKDNILPLRRKVMRDAIRAVDYGWQPFAVSWEIRDGLYIPNLEPLLPDTTLVLKDGNKFAGLENQPEKGETVKFGAMESWAPALDAEAGYAYGRSRLENVRTTAWAPWLNTALRMRELEGKISGIIPIVSHPPGGYQDDDGNSVNYATEANTILSELPQGRGVRIETALDVAQLLEHPEFAAKLAELKLFDVDFLDAGSVTPAVSGFISLLEYWDKQLFRGMLRPERAGLEAVAAGSRADSEQHTETGAADSEAIDADLTESFDEHVVRTALRLNFGEEKARRIHVISTPLLKWKQQVFREMLTRLVSIPDIAISVAKSLDMSAIFSQMSLPELKSFVMETIEKPPAPPTDSGLKPSNGNGRMNRADMEQFAAVLSEHFSH